LRLRLQAQTQLGTLPIYFHHPATLALNDLGMGGPHAHEPRHHPALHHLQAGLDPPTAKEASRPSPRNPARIPRPRKPSHLRPARPAQSHRARRHPRSRAAPHQAGPTSPSWHRRSRPRRHHRRLVPPDPTRGRSTSARHLATPPESHDRRLLRPAHEDQMGQLQPARPHHPPQHRARQETPRMPRIHRRPRVSAPTRAHSRPALCRDHGSDATELARDAGVVESVAGKA